MVHDAVSFGKSWRFSHSLHIWCMYSTCMPDTTRCRCHWPRFFRKLKIVTTSRVNLVMSSLTVLVTNPFAYTSGTVASEAAAATRSWYTISWKVHVFNVCQCECDK